MNKFLLLGLALLLTAPAGAQTAFPVPTSYSLESRADYDQYAPQIIETVNWLEASTLPADNPQRLKANAFLMKWLTGSPTVTVDVQPYALDLYGKDPNLLMAFMGGWTRYALQHPTEKDKVVLNTEGVKTLLNVYKLKGGKGNKKASELVKLEEQGKLSEWVKSHLKA